MGPFDGPPAVTCHFNPLMTRSKKGSRFRRVIIDLSWPHSQSVNNGISRTDYIDGPITISLPTPDDMERAIVHAGRGSFLYKTDLARGTGSCVLTPSTGPYSRFSTRRGDSWTYAPLWLTFVGYGNAEGFSGIGPLACQEGVCVQGIHR